MQVYVEIVFDIAYLITVITLGFIMTKKKGLFRLFGIMTLILGFGDAFHLVPRIYSLITGTMDQNFAALGFGKLMTSITMTIFYVMLYHFWSSHYKAKNTKPLTITIYILAIARIALCLFPQNLWLSANPSFTWGIYRNIPFAILGGIIVYLFFNKSTKSKDDYFRFAWLAVLLSFAFYIPVVLFASKTPAIGALMLPKTVCYVWLVIMGYKTSKDELA